jgi:hypothetical protein
VESPRGLRRLRSRLRARPVRLASGLRRDCSALRCSFAEVVGSIRVMSTLSAKKIRREPKPAVDHLHPAIDARDRQSCDVPLHRAVSNTSRRLQPLQPRRFGKSDRSTPRAVASGNS